MTNKSKIKLIISFLVFIFIFQPVLVSATISDQLQHIGKNAGYFDRSVPEEESIVIAIAKLINIILSFLGVIFVILLIYSGFMWMTAGGNEAQVEKAKKIMIRAIIGVIIVLVSFVATWFVMGTFSDVLKDL